MVSLIGRRIPTTGIEGAQAGGLGDVFGKFAQILADPLTPALKREKLSEMSRQNIGAESLAARFGGGDVDPAQAAADAVRAGIDPGHLAGYDIYSTTKRYGPESPQAFTSAMARPGANYGNTIQGTREDFSNRMAMQQAQEATKLKVAGQTPEYVMGPNGPVVAPRSESYGQRPVLPLGQEQGVAAARAQGQPGGISALSPADKAFISAEPRAPEPYNVGLPGGGTQAMVFGPNGELAPVTYQGQPVPSIGKLVGTTSEAFGVNDPIAKDLYNKKNATDQAVSAIDTLDKSLARPDADQALGWLGSGARLFTDLRSQTMAALKFFEPMAGDSAVMQSANKAVDMTMASPQVQDAVQKLRGLGVDNTVMRSQIINLAYLIAKTQNPTGTLSGPDFNHALATVGGAIHDPQSMRQVLQQVKTTAQQNYKIELDNYNAARSKQAPLAGPTMSQPAPPVVDYKSKYGLE